MLPAIIAPKSSFNMCIFAKKIKLIRLVQHNDWVVFILVGSIFLYIFMLLSLQRESTVKEFLTQKFADATNSFLSWIIISVVFCVVLSALLSQFIPLVPKRVSDIHFFGYELNKFGFTFLSIGGFYMIKNILSYLFFAGTGFIKKWEIFSFTVSRFYFVASVVLMILCLASFFYNFNKLQLADYIFGAMVTMLILKQFFYIFHMNNILPEKWYYKFLYICTLQIVPYLVLWKVLFF